MFRTFLIVAATLLAVGTSILVMKVPVRADMRRTARVITGLSFFGLLFFGIAKVFDDNYGWWYFPMYAFAIAAGLGMVRTGDITRLIRREKPNRWLVETTQSMPVTGATKETVVQKEFDPADLEEEPDYEHFADLFPYEEEQRPRRPLDDYYIADEADTWPTELDLTRLDDFIFTSRHGYLVHDRGGDDPVCDVMTISPGMSVSDLIDAAKLHACKKVAAQ